MPCNEEAEKSLLGALMIDNNGLDRLGIALLPEHFYFGVHARIYNVIKQLFARSERADPITLRPYFEQDPTLESLGGVAYLAKLVRSSVSLQSVADYAGVIRDTAIRRELVQIGCEIQSQACDALVEDPPAEQIERAEAQLYALATEWAGERHAVRIAQAADAAIKSAQEACERGDGLVGLSTGLTSLDELIGGLHATDLLILAARPAMGKTALATTIALNASRTGASTLLFSLEMASEQIGSRVIAREAVIDAWKLRRGALLETDLQFLLEKKHGLDNVKLFIDESAALDIDQIHTRSRRHQRRYGLDLIVIDYLQLIEPPAAYRGEDTVRELTKITARLKGLAKLLKVPVLVLSQLNRGVESREDKRPTLPDLRASGSIEQDADVVLFLYREAYYLGRSRPKRRESETDSAFEKRSSNWMERLDAVRNQAEVILAKNRHGPIETALLEFDSSTATFHDPPSSTEDGSK